MGCTVSDNILTNCFDDSVNAGIGQIYFVFAEQVSAVTTGANHTVTAITTVGSAKFVKMDARFESKDLTTEMTRENYGKSIEKTLNAFIPNLRSVNAELLNDAATGGKLFVIFATNNADETSGNKIAKVFGWDNKLGADGGAMLVVNEVIEAEIGGQIGYNVTFTAKGTELLRDFNGDITVEDGATGTTVSLGS